MADRVQRYETFQGSLEDGQSIMLKSEDGDYVRYEDVAALHADIIEQGRKVQIAASGDSKYGAMSDSEFIEWVARMLEGKQ